MLFWQLHIYIISSFVIIVNTFVAFLAKKIVIINFVAII
ncbi:putative membrane protein [Clostridioides difficile CD38]|nr:putative membrane protein [Clostridioides difficile CD38]